MTRLSKENLTCRLPYMTGKQSYMITHVSFQVITLPLCILNEPTTFIPFVNSVQKV